MDSLFGIPLTSIMVALLALVAGSLAILVWIAVRNPLLVRMGLRNVVRRKAQTTLIVVGLMLSTLIISAAFATGDTVGFSITNDLFNQLEEVDFVIGFDADEALDTDDDALTDEFLAQLLARFADDPDIDGISGMIAVDLPVVNREQRLSEPAARFVGIDPETIGTFRALRGTDGQPIAASTLGGNRAYITERLADEVNAGAGDTITVFFELEATDFEVLGIVRDTSITGSLDLERLIGNLSGGLVVHIDTARALTDAPGELSRIAVSMRGGTRDTLDLSNSVEDRLEAFIDAHPEASAEIQITKKELIELAELAGSTFVTVFLVFGLFSIAAGIMLIFLIFVMLAAERRSEMGMARAIGMNRLHLTQNFLAEGMAYNLGSAAVGALLGLGVAYMLVFVMGRIVGDQGLPITFHLNLQGLIISYSLGVVLTFATVAFSSWRAANLNIVRAIRDLPEPEPLRGTDRSLGRLLQATAGALWFVAWIALAAVWAVLGSVLFVVGLGFYGLPFIAIGLVAGWFIFGARAASRPFAMTRGWWRRALYVLWWIAFTPAALMAPLTWGLLRTKGWADRYRNAGGWAVLMLALGAILIYLGGWQLHFLFAYTGGTTVAVLAVAMLAVYFGLGASAAFSAAGLALIWYWLLPLPFSLFSEAGEGWQDPIGGVLQLVGITPDPGDGNIEMFFVSGLSITAAATLVVIFNADRLLHVVDALGGLLRGLAPALRTAIAYPLAAKFRTAMTLAMFGLIVFSLVVMAFLTFNFSQLFLGDDAAAGYDVRVTGNALNRTPDLREALRETGYDVDARIGGVGTAVSQFPVVEANLSGGEAGRYRLLGVDDEFLRLASLPLQFRAVGYDSDEAVIEALRTDPTVAIVDGSRVGGRQGGGLFGGDREPEFIIPLTDIQLRDEPWQPIPITLREPGTDQVLDLRVIGVLEPGVAGVLVELFAVITARENVINVFDGGQVDDFFVNTTGDRSTAAAKELADDIESALLDRGVQAESILQLINERSAQSAGFQLLFEGFMGLGLIVGVAALGVIAFRTVVERRQQIGMLRAIGYSRRLIAVSFFFESSFIALTGIVMGLLLGSALAYNLLTSDDFAGGADIDFQVPWLRLALICGVAYGASAVMTAIPARSAARVAAADALRYE